MYLITGATGIVGSHLVVELLRLDKSVRVLRREDSDMKVLYDLLEFHGLSKRPEEVLGDITDPISLFDAMSGVSICFHCAAMVSFNNADEADMAQVNVRGTENVVNACLQNGVGLAYLSSTAAIGEAKRGGERSEQSPWTTDKGKSAYALTKHYAELEVMRGIQEGLNAVVVNPGVIIGPGNWGQSSTTLFLSGIKGLTFYPEGSNGFVDARDVAHIVSRMSQNMNDFTGQHLLIGENMSFKEVFTLLARAGGRPTPSFKASKRLVKVLINVLRVFEALGIRAGGLSAHSLRSSISEQVFDTGKVKSLGFELRPISEAIQYTNEVYQYTIEKRT